LITKYITTEKVQISKDEYNNLTPSQNTYTFDDGPLVVTISKEIVNYNDYEIERNEAKRTIKLLNKDYVSQLEREFSDLLK
jgi:hypothetical protein